MDNWRRKRSDNYNQEGSRNWSKNTTYQGSWQPTVPDVPSWEKKFCWEIGGVPWRKVVETQNLLSAYDNMVKWDNSAGEEAFHDAKARYWAKINGLPCDIPLPDPNAYIDDVDWDSNTDGELMEDLYNNDVVADVNKGILIFGDTYAKSQGLTDSGWGDAEDGFKMITDADLDKIRKESDRIFAELAADVELQGIDHGGKWSGECEWEKKVRESGHGGGKEWNCDSGWDKGESKVNKLGNNWEDNENGWDRWESKVNKFRNNWEDNGNNGNNMSRYKTTRFHGDESEFGRKQGNNYGGYNGNYRENNGRYQSNWVNGADQANNQWERNNRSGRRRENLVRDEGLCRPINHNRSAKQGNHCSWEKSVK